jgi:hypothetical protein
MTTNLASTLLEREIKSKNIDVTALGEDFYWIVEHAPFPTPVLNTCTRQMLEQALVSKDPIFYANFGHGEEGGIGSTVEGVCLVDKYNARLLKDRVVYAFSCLTARELGPTAVALGCKTYVGYNDVIWLVLHEVPDRPAEVAVGNIETMSKFPLEFASGSTTEEAFKKAVEEYDKWISYWNGKDPNCYSQFAWNKQHLVFLGDKTERIISPLEFQLNEMMVQVIPTLIMIMIMSILTSIIGLLTE